MKRSITDYFQKQPVQKIAKVAAVGVKVVPEKASPSKDTSSAKDSSPLKPKHDSPAISDTTSTSNAASTLVEDSSNNWIDKLSPATKELLKLELSTIDQTWLNDLGPEISKPYFLTLRRFLTSQYQSGKTIFPPPNDIYTWSRLTPLDGVKVIILGQDPYHNHGQAHGLAFSVAPPTLPPPSLVNIYKELATCYPGFKPLKTGYLAKWAEQGVLMLNACLTVEAHKANSHANRGWEQFTEKVLQIVLAKNPHVVIMAWGNPAAKRVDKIRPGSQHLVLKSVHPSPLSASRGWFGSAHFTKANEWLKSQGIDDIDWVSL